MKILVWCLGVLLLSGAILFGTFTSTASTLAASINQTTFTVPKTSALMSDALRRSCPPTLREGSRGGWVYLLQAAMVDKRITDWTGHFLVIDGYYGARTTYVVAVYQQNHGLSSDGKTGPQTWHALGAC